MFLCNHYNKLWLIWKGLLFLYTLYKTDELVGLWQKLIIPFHNNEWRKTIDSVDQGFSSTLKETLFSFFETLFSERNTTISSHRTFSRPGILNSTIIRTNSPTKWSSRDLIHSCICSKRTHRLGDKLACIYELYPPSAFIKWEKWRKKP